MNIHPNSQLDINGLARIRALCTKQTLRQLAIKTAMIRKRKLALAYLATSDPTKRSQTVLSFYSRSFLIGNILHR
jgi:hypothetical protein